MTNGKGPESLDALKQITQKDNYEHRLMRYSKFYSKDGRLVDKGLVVFFKGPHSFTGEDSVEFYVHGSRAVVDLMLAELGKLPHLKPAAPGEFTKRAFFNEKMDLTQAESLNDLILAETPAQLHLANRMNNISKQLNPIRQNLINLTAELEANIDFGEDVQNQQGESWKERMKNTVTRLITVFEELIKTAKKGILIRDGVKIALIGRTNVGKSSLMNRLAERDVAIVSDIPGTTRDSLELKIRMADLNVTLFDTAGIRETNDILELEGIKRSRSRAEEAHLLVLVVAPLPTNVCTQYLINEVDSLLSGFSNNSNKFVLINKFDLMHQDMMDNIRKAYPSEKILPISCHNGQGISTLISILEENVKELTSIEENEMVLSRERHLNLLFEGYEGLQSFVDNIDVDTALAAENLRECVDVIGEITGVISKESVLDKLFSSFCVGK
ncbi:unnamed protein product [Bursaphelenchus okinawaensis]|uniref:TrmE-type G domain-containing protein n=1 Tax=Bursaphelenchus okinawaensis TaxID=465554 RepID=A0A811JV30_9BILA|nr:unnamed protein product [Bursaphelenchus okinawaensis]CAG9084638.1 unnamed protein product [Bursaphelenchus okinawaensis]